MLLGPADLIDRAMRDGKVDLVRRRAGRFGAEAEVPEEGLGDSVMTKILLQGPTAFVRESALAAESRD